MTIANGHASGPSSTRTRAMAANGLASVRAPLAERRGVTGAVRGWGAVAVRVPADGGSWTDANALFGAPRPLGALPAPTGAIPAAWRATLYAASRRGSSRTSR